MEQVRKWKGSVTFGEAEQPKVIEFLIVGTRQTKSNVLSCEVNMLFDGTSYDRNFEIATKGSKVESRELSLIIKTALKNCPEPLRSISLSEVQLQIRKI
jgi:hypothetical protein